VREERREEKRGERRENDNLTEKDTFHSMASVKKR